MEGRSIAGLRRGVSIIVILLSRAVGPVLKMSMVSRPSSSRVEGQFCIILGDYRIRTLYSKSVQKLINYSVGHDVEDSVTKEWLGGVYPNRSEFNSNVMSEISKKRAPGDEDERHLCALAIQVKRASEGAQTHKTDVSGPDVSVSEQGVEGSMEHEGDEPDA